MPKACRPRASKHGPWHGFQQDPEQDPEQDPAQDPEQGPAQVPVENNPAACTVLSMNRTVRLAVVGVLIAVLASALPHPTSASASTSRYTLRWGFNQATKYIRSDATRVVSYAALGYGWSITPSSAPNAAMSRTDGHPCSTSTSVSRFGKASFTVSPNRVTNGEAMQECRAKLSGPSGWSARALTPSSISNSYYVLSNERIPQIDNGGVFCVADCRYVEGRPANVWRLKPPAGSTTWRWCFKEEFPAIDTDADITRDPFIVEVICPHRINFTRPANRYENATFTVRASSSLGKSVTLESLTPAVCTVKSTNTLDRHTVESLSVSRRRTCELRASAAGGQYEASASATTSFYVRNRAEGVVCCDTPLPDGGTPQTTQSSPTIPKTSSSTSLGR